MEICRYVLNSFAVFLLFLTLMWAVQPQFQAVNIPASQENLHKPTWFRTSVSF